MLEIDRLVDDRDWIDLGFVEREAKPSESKRFGIQLHLTELSLSNIVSVL